MRAEQVAISLQNRLLPQALGVIEKDLVGALLVLVGQVKVPVGQEALCGQQVEGFAS